MVLHELARAVTVPCCASTCSMLLVWLDQQLHSGLTVVALVTCICSALGCLHS
jgi:hypothetical protein